MPPRPRVAQHVQGQPRRLIRQAERNMLREMYNFDRHAARVCFVSIQIVLWSTVRAKNKDKSHWAEYSGWRA
jgi:hypothetical protein